MIKNFFSKQQTVGVESAEVSDFLYKKRSDPLCKTQRTPPTHGLVGFGLTLPNPEYGQSQPTELH
jgi:hypothetical protein